MRVPVRDGVILGDAVAFSVIEGDMLRLRVSVGADAEYGGVMVGVQDELREAVQLEKVPVLFWVPEGV